MSRCSRPYSSSLSPNQGPAKEVFVHNAQNKDMFTSAVATMAHIWTAPSEESGSDYSVPYEIQFYLEDIYYPRTGAVENLLYSLSKHRNEYRKA
ncbi:hypothetical protein MHYP_G00358550 [Metynnis hypsauchen]